MSASLRALVVATLCLSNAACFPDKEPGPGKCDFAGSRVCRPTLVCRFDNECVAPCQEPTTMDCELADAGPGRSSCSLERGWAACSPALCTTDRECVIDGGAVGYVGSQACLSDGGYDVCREASNCAPAPGVCNQARRVVGDVVGCSMLSYQQLADWRARESCAEDDGKDNDCDGYVDELFDDDGGTELACGLGLCRSRSEGRLLAYRTCSAPTCSQALLSSALADAGYAPLDLCDGVDRDCSGVAGVGPVRDLLDGTEVAVQGDESGDEEVYRVVASRVVDGGLELVYFRLSSDGGLSTLVSLANGPGPFWPQLARSNEGNRVVSVATWRIDGGFAVTAADNATVRRPAKQVIYTPAFQPLQQPHRAAVIDFDRKALVTARRPDGGVIANVISLLSANTIITIAAADHVLPLSSLLLSGNGSSRAVLVGHSSLDIVLPGLCTTDSNDLGRQRDGGVSDAGNRFVPLVDVLPMPSTADFSSLGFAEVNQSLVRLSSVDGVAMDAVGSWQVLGTFAPTINLVTLASFGPLDELFTETTSPQLFPNQGLAGSVLAAVALDGGVTAVYGARTDLNEFHLHTMGKLIDRVEDTPSMAWSSKQPRHVLVASPELRDGGSPVIRTRLVCAPTTPF